MLQKRRLKSLLKYQRLKNQGPVTGFVTAQPPQHKVSYPNRLCSYVAVWGIKAWKCIFSREEESEHNIFTRHKLLFQGCSCTNTQAPGSQKQHRQTLGSPAVAVFSIVSSFPALPFPKTTSWDFFHFLPRAQHPNVDHDLSPLFWSLSRS